MQNTRTATPKARAASKSATKPINFPADVVDLLEELLTASGTGLTVDDYARRYLSHGIVGTLCDSLIEREKLGWNAGVVDDLAEDTGLADTPNLRRMAAVARKWAPHRKRMEDRLAFGIG